MVDWFLASTAIWANKPDEYLTNVSAEVIKTPPPIFKNTCWFKSTISC